MSIGHNQNPPAMAQESHQARRARIAPTLPQGFTLDSHGRSGFIYYRAGDRVIEIYVEMSGVAHFDMLVSPEGLDHWIHPEKLALTDDERRFVLSEFSEWLKLQSFKTDYQ